MNKYILSIDEGTTGVTALIVNANNFSLIDKYNQEFEQIFPKPGLVEHDLDMIWRTTESVITNVLSKNNISKTDIISIGITNQRETTCAYTKSGDPLANAIVWQDRRTSEYCNNKEASYKGLENKTGLPLDPYFSATKMNWLLNNNDDVKSAYENNDLLLSTIDTFLLYRLSGNSSFKTDASNASRTLLMDLKSCNWDNELLSFFDIASECLPSIEDSFGEFGKTKGLNFLPDGIPITCILGDQQSALFGQAGFKKSSLKCTYGTGAFILLNTGEDIIKSSNGLLTTVAYKHNGKVIYALEGSSYIAGAAVQWLRDKLKIIKSASDVQTLAEAITDLAEVENLLFLPFFTGIGSPYWNSEAKAAIIGMTRDTSDQHIARACLDGIALSINDSITALLDDINFEVTSIKVDGGASNNSLLMQIQSNFSGKDIIRPKVIETTSYGAALGAAIGSNQMELDQLTNLWEEDKVFTPINHKYYAQKSKQWKETIKKIY